MIWWDLAMMIALLWTGLFTPYQIAFLNAPKVLTEGADGLWLFNRLLDVFFIIDVAIECSTMYQEELIDGGAWIDSRRMIIRRYAASGWLLIDAVSCFPYFAISLIIEAASDGSDGGSFLMRLRLVKLVRMMKMSRCMKAAARVGPYAKELLMGRLELTYARLQVTELILSLLFFTHLQACFYALFSSAFTDDGDTPTWKSTFQADHEQLHGAPPEPWDIYVAALYWSAMTVTGIGYGEMLPVNTVRVTLTLTLTLTLTRYGEMLPVNTGERIINTFFMLLSGMVWTYILSTAAGIAATLNPNKVLFHNTMDQLNYFMRERSLPAPMRRQLRDFFEHARHAQGHASASASASASAGSFATSSSTQAMRETSTKSTRPHASCLPTPGPNAGTCERSTTTRRC